MSLLAMTLLAMTLACHAPRGPHADATAFEIGGKLTGVAVDGNGIYVARTWPTHGGLTRYERGKIDSAHSLDLEGNAGLIATSGDATIVAVSRTFADTTLATKIDGSNRMRGEPGAVVGSRFGRTWDIAIDSTEWSLVTALAGDGDGGAIVGGSFSGTLRAGARVVASAGSSDGFVLRLTKTGQVAWLVRVGGNGADAVQGVAIADGAVAIAGTYSGSADLLGEPLEPIDDKVPLADGFVAELDGATGARRWSATFGGREAESVAGVAIDAHGRVAVAGTVRVHVRVGGRELAVRGDADGVVAWWSDRGAPLHAVLVGGDGFDGLRAITAVGDRIVVGGFFAGALPLGDRTLHADGGDAFVAALDASGRVVGSWQLGGPGREEIVALAPQGGGVIAGVAHTAALVIDGVRAAPAPADPMTGAALVRVVP